MTIATAQLSNKHQAYEHIRDMLMTGALQPGNRVSDFVLSKKIGFSRGPIREALSRLESDGLVEQIPHYGTFVRKLDRKEIDELYELRVLLEGYAAGRAAKKHSLEDIEQLNYLCQRMEEMAQDCSANEDGEQDEQTAKAWVSLDAKFHMCIVNACGNRRVSSTVADFRVLSRLFTGRNRRDMKESWQDMLKRASAEHRRIAQAIINSDAAQSRELMEKHITEAQVKALAGYEAQEAEDSAQVNTDQLWGHSVPDIVSRIERYRPQAGQSIKEDSSV